MNPLEYYRCLNAVTAFLQTRMQGALIELIFDVGQEYGVTLFANGPRGGGPDRVDSWDFEGEDSGSDLPDEDESWDSEGQDERLEMIKLTIADILESPTVAVALERHRAAQPEFSVWLTGPYEQCQSLYP